MIKEIPLIGAAAEQMPHLYMLHDDDVEKRPFSFKGACLMRINIDDQISISEIWESLEDWKKYCILLPRHIVGYQECFDVEFLKNSMQFEDTPECRSIIGINDSRLNCHNCPRFNKLPEWPPLSRGKRSIDPSI